MKKKIIKTLLSSTIIRVTVFALLILILSKLQQFYLYATNDNDSVNH